MRLFDQSRWNVAHLRRRLGMVSTDLHQDLAMLNGLPLHVHEGADGFWHLLPGRRPGSPASGAEPR